MNRWVERGYAGINALKQSARACKVLLWEHRYFATVAEGEYRDHEGNYVPWFTFPAIEALRNWDLRSKSIFEYGAGYSTLFWAARAKSVISVEHDPEWHRKITALAPPNARIILAAITKQANDSQADTTACEVMRYVQTIEDLGTFDIIVVDGYAASRTRLRCAQAAYPHLAPDGLMILDNSDWLPATAMYLRQCGLIEVDFNGFVPGAVYCQTTSFFFTRPFNFPSIAPRRPVPPVGGRFDTWDAAQWRTLAIHGVDPRGSRGEREM